jgi:membrane-associated phospholipid phosphatase
MRRIALALLAATLFAGSVAGVYAISFASGPGRRADAAVFDRVSRHDAPQLREFGQRVGSHMLNTIAAVAVLTVAGFLSLLALTGRTRLRGWLMPILIGGSLATTELTKAPLGELGRDLAPLRVAVDAFPSGHSTLAMTIVLSAVIAAPQRFRAAATFVGIALATLIALLIVVGGLHPPSDVVGGYLVAAAWAALLTPFLRRENQTPGRKTGDLRNKRVVPALVIAAIGVALLVLAGVAGAYVVGTFGLHRMFLALVATFAISTAVIVAAIGALADVSVRTGRGRTPLP